MKTALTLSVLTAGIIWIKRRHTPKALPPEWVHDFYHEAVVQ